VRLDFSVRVTKALSGIAKSMFA